MNSHPLQLAQRSARSADDREWRIEARCRRADPAIFFHPDGERGVARRQRQQAAKLVCEQCPVARQCREHSLSFGEAFGIWGGLTEEERSELLPARIVNLRTHRRTGVADGQSVAGGR